MKLTTQLQLVSSSKKRSSVNRLSHKPKCGRRTKWTQSHPTKKKKINLPPRSAYKAGFWSYLSDCQLFNFLGPCHCYNLPVLWILRAPPWILRRAERGSSWAFGAGASVCNFLALSVRQRSKAKGVFRKNIAYTCTIMRLGVCARIWRNEREKTVSTAENNAMYVNTDLCKYCIV
jgi:hypothetical protein